MRRPLIGTSWKMNLTATEATAYLRELVPRVDGLQDRDIFILPPFTAIWVARRELAGTSIGWGAQDVHEEEAGAYTGDVSAAMLVDLGCRYVEIGHSERRRAHGESDARIAAKVRTALRHDLTPILCVGETRRFPLRVARSTVIRQLSRSLAGVAGTDLDRVAVAYEPVWAIGVGARAAPLGHTEAMQGAIGAWLSAHGARTPRVIYGGSIDTSNAASILALAEVDGLFVGRAALEPVAFSSIARTPIDGLPHKKKP
ncbi:MAG: triose-phosphate isomerase [Candidatus Limnocylindria bacterium]